MSTTLEHSHKGCLFGAMSFPEEIGLENLRIFVTRTWLNAQGDKAKVSMYTLNINASKSVKRVDQVNETRLFHPRNRSHITFD